MYWTRGELEEAFRLFTQTQTPPADIYCLYDTLFRDTSCEISVAKLPEEKRQEYHVFLLQYLSKSGKLLLFLWSSWPLSFFHRPQSKISTVHLDHAIILFIYFHFIKCYSYTSLRLPRVVLSENLYCNIHRFSLTNAVHCSCRYKDRRTKHDRIQTRGTYGPGQNYRLCEREEVYGHEKCRQFS